MTERILVLRPGAIGDTLVTLPALAALRQQFPSAEIVAAGNATALPAVAATGAIDRWVSFDDGRVTRLFTASPPTPDDAFLGLSAAVAWGRDADGTLGHALERRGARQVVVAPSRPPPERPVHVARHLLASLAPLGVAAGAADLTVPPMPLPAAVLAAADAEVGRVGLLDRPFVVLHPGSGSPAKNWPAEHFATVVRALAERHGIASVVLGGPADADALVILADQYVRESAVLVDRPLLVVAALLRRSRGFLGNDSGLSHLAGVLDVPTLALFGPTDPAVWAPLGARVRVLRSPSLEALQPDAVLDTLMTVLGGE